jgi:hypothetical protein
MPAPENEEQPDLKDEGWAAPTTHDPAQDTKIARRLKAIAIALVILLAAVAVLYVSSARD